MSVAVQAGDAPSLGVPQALFAANKLRSSLMDGYDVLPDGKNFVITMAAADKEPRGMTIVQNWFVEFSGRRR